MPLVRIEISVDGRDEARRIMARFADGKTDPTVEQEVLDAVWAQGRVPRGRPICLGMTNGRPVRLKFDVDVTPGTR
ncbi:hypothetical protein [Myceligenerans pegani]|uniref:Uncharacterized protein n=1 Tax=Myceligenerans pegani TaxID=2776917 RepID=A0ABR9MYX4_9MICO|nr:hypothetical protein [Myceligenerans sp. TRM 65318]MBE1876600.1 hypothetical protein [Myceligenerans sp. TRM 65318]MBE3018871.1 hypothetical protein [Myceligenerans sp. TRM 65318]